MSNYVLLLKSILNPNIVIFFVVLSLCTYFDVLTNIKKKVKYIIIFL